MSSLSLKIPPPILMLLFAGLMWLISLWVPDASKAAWVNLLNLFILLLGIFCSTSGSRAFKKVKTTINPMKPNTASSLVTTGIYQYTRNPMYLGLFLLLIAWGLYLSNIGALLCVIGFVVYLSYFQIVPEEKALEKLFGTDYLQYKKTVRRWF